MQKLIDLNARGFNVTWMQNKRAYIKTFCYLVVCWASILGDWDWIISILGSFFELEFKIELLVLLVDVMLVRFICLDDSFTFKSKFFCLIIYISECLKNRLKMIKIVGSKWRDIKKNYILISIVRIIIIINTVVGRVIYKFFHLRLV